jgi:hypothetical protein
MYKPTHIARSPRDHFMRAVEEEFSKFERREREFRQADQDERAAKLRLPVPRNRPLVQRAAHVMRPDAHVHAVQKR